MTQKWRDMYYLKAAAKIAWNRYGTTIQRLHWALIWTYGPQGIFTEWQGNRPGIDVHGPQDFDQFKSAFCEWAAKELKNNVHRDLDFTQRGSL